MKSTTTKVPLSKDRCSFELKRIMVFFRCEPQEGADYINAVYEQVKDWDAEIFKQVCIRLAGTMKPYNRPVVDEFKEARRSIESNQRSAKPKCAKCKDLRMLPDQPYITIIRSGREYQVAPPCPECVPPGVVST